nr:hypothetical protein [Tanacetum cinerariifolium]
LEFVEAGLLVYQQNESVFEEDIKLLKLEVQLKENALVVLRQNLEKAKQERDDLKLKLQKFQTSSKNLREFMPPKPDLVFNNAPNDVETDHPAFTVKPSPTVLPQSKLVSINAVRPVSTVVSIISVTKPRQAKTIVTKTNSPPRTHINHSPSPKAIIFPLKITAAKALIVNVAKGNPQHALKDKGVIDSRCLRHMTGSMSYLSDFEELNGGYVSFGGNSKGGKISSKGKITTEKLDFDDVYFVKELKFNLFNVSQMCDKK